MEPSSDAGLANVRTLESGREAAEERRLWARFRDASNPEAFFESWLDLQCRAIEGVHAGLLFAPSPKTGAFSPVATWPPHGRPARHLAAAAERVLKERRALALQLDPLDPKGEQGAKGEAGEGSGAAGVRAPGRDSRTVAAQPVEVEGALIAVVAVDLEPRPKAELERVLRQLAWGAAWLELQSLGGEPGGRAAGLEQLLYLVASPLEHERFRASATAFVNELATHFSCDRVSLGFQKSGHVKLQTVSHSARFSERANITRAIEAAMDESLDQEAAVLWPSVVDAAPQVTRFHAELASEADARALCTVPLSCGSRFHGAVTFERGEDQPFRPSELQLIEAALSLSGPTLVALHRDDRWFGAKLREAIRDRLGELVGPRHVALKLSTAGALLLIAFLAIAKGEFRVAADAVLEARVMRAAVAPFDGYVPEAFVRAGDLVSEGQVLASLDDRELVLEQSRWQSELEQLRKQYRRALGDRDAPQVGIYGAQIEQAGAQLGLVEGQLAKTQIRAPFDGVVVTGDLSQQLGAPVQRGQVLFEVAPLDEYRLVLDVDERDIDEVVVGQAGSLVFTAFPDESFGFVVEKLTPVSEPSEGRNTFRVEAQLEEAPARIRPGMEGVGKIRADRRRLLWIWTHEATDWLRLAAWNWMP